MMKVKNMTEGNTFKVLLFFAVPMILSVTIQQLYNLADNFIAGNLITNLDSFNAVGIIYPITVIFLDIAVGFGVGLSIIVARLFGAKDYHKMKEAIHTGFIMMLILSFITTIIGLLIIRPLLSNMIKVSDGVGCFNEGLSYMIIYIFGVIFVFLYNFSMYIFQALGNSKTPLYFLIFSTILNVFLDILFIKAFHMQANGLALGTILSYGVAAILSFVILKKEITKINDETTAFNKALVKEISIISIPSILQGLFISIGGVLVVSILTHFGGNNVAGGYSAAYKICYIAINIFTVLCNALSSFVSQNIGAKKYERIKNGYLTTLILSLAFCILATIVIYPFKEFWVRIFVNEDSVGDVSEIINSGMKFITCVVPFFILMVIKIPFDGLLKGSADMLGFTLGTSIDLIFRVVFAYVLGSNFGYQGVFYAWPIGWFIGALISVLMTLSGRWKKISGYNKSPIQNG